MKIFIDESGIFSSAQKWSSVGALIIPDESFSLVQSELSKLKVFHGLSDDDEFKQNRPDCSCPKFREYITFLRDAKCTLHVVSMIGSGAESDVMIESKEDLKAGINKWREITECSDEYVDHVLSLLDGMSNQLYAQLRLQALMVSQLIDRVLVHYAKHSPKSLSTFEWVIDRKGVTETAYEEAYKAIFIGVVTSLSASQPKPLLVTDGYDYSYFINAFHPKSATDDSNIIEEAKRIYEQDLHHLRESLHAVDMGSILNKHLALGDSKESDGLQSVDLLVSSVNRCLKLNFTENSEMASALGSLMMNGPHVDDRTPHTISFSGTGVLEDGVEKIIKSMNNSAIHVFSDQCRTNYSKLVERK